MLIYDWDDVDGRFVGYLCDVITLVTEVDSVLFKPLAVQVVSPIDEDEEGTSAVP